MRVESFVPLPNASKLVVLYLGTQSMVLYIIIIIIIIIFIRSHDPQTCRY